MTEVDIALSECEKIIKTNTETIKSKLSSHSPFPPKVLRDLSKANAQKNRLMIRRITLLSESSDPTVLEMIEKLMKIKPSK